MEQFAECPCDTLADCGCHNGLRMLFRALSGAQTGSAASHHGHPCIISAHACLGLALFWSELCVTIGQLPLFWIARLACSSLVAVWQVHYIFSYCAKGQNRNMHVRQNLALMLQTSNPTNVSLAQTCGPGW